METVTVKQIHSAFDSASESLIDGANAFLINYDEKLKVIADKRREAIYNANAGLGEAFYSVAHQMERAKLLRSLGFTGTSEVTELTRPENQRAKLISEAVKLEEKEKRKYGEMIDSLESQKREFEQAVYYKEKYPFLKFITDKQLDRLCKKYSLVYAPVGNYTGNVPDKNLEEIKNARIDEKDFMGVTFTVKMSDKEMRKKVVISEERFKIERVRFSPFSELAKEAGFKYPYLDYYTRKTFTKDDSKQGLFIAAGKSQFNLNGLKKLKPTAYVPDPIVFRFVKGGVLVISKWGDEANDPELVVAELN
jgi:hypothetical protein